MIRMTTKHKTLQAKLIAWAAVIALMIGLLPACAGATSATVTADNTFTFSNSGITASLSGTGYEISGTDLTITAAGTYALKGTCSDGSVTVKKGTTGVTLVLNGLDLTSADTAPIACNKSSGVTIEVASGTVNTLTDNEKNNNETYPDNTAAENAVIKCKDGSQVTICGSGTLNINANGKNGIKSGATTETEGEASLTIRDAVLNITASVNDAINAEQLLNIESGTLKISAADDAIHSDLVLNIGALGTAGPTIDIQESCEGIEAAELNIRSGNISITSADDCMNAANSDLSKYAFSMTISGGTITAYSSGGDGFDSNGSLTISGGTISVWTANTSDNQPLDADGTITVSGGTVLAAGGSNGMGTRLNASQPYVTFGSSGGMRGQKPGGMGAQRPDGMTWQKPDGMTGQRPEGKGSQMPADMAGQKSDSTSGQKNDSFAGQMPGSMDSQQSDENAVSLSANSAFSIQDASGNSVYSGTAPCNIRYMFFSSADLTSDSSYTLFSGSTSIATATAQTGSVTGQQGGMAEAAPGRIPGEEAAAPQNFTDVSASDRFSVAVSFVKSAGLMDGTSSTSFSPGATVTRGMFASILYRLVGSPAVSAENTFADVEPGAYYADAVVWISASDIATGYGNGSFGPDDALTREQLAAILYRYAQYTGCDVAQKSDFSAFTDAGQISAYAADALSWVNAAGIVNGTSATTLSPKATATRAQTAVFLMRFCQNFSPVKHV